MRRFNLFKSSHSTLRSQLFETMQTLQFANFNHHGEREEVFNMIEDLVLAINRHAEQEANFIIPLVANAFPGVTGPFNREDHVWTVADRLVHRISFYEQTGSPRVKRLTEIAIRNAFLRFVDYVLAGMQQQEEQLNTLLWAEYTDEELRNIQNRLENQQTISEWLNNSIWMVRDMDTEEIAKWLMSMQLSLPTQMYEMLEDHIASHLPFLRWEQVANRMMARGMVA
ncbi:hypothetical protein KJS94_05725 [Flavihumibacter rivuli]|uniref:hypothetical protein n=1 Tax=Flavihumibacter rivuli TaxID=2838156 RepID=UPI001BDEF38C|nr:hypothetical protein [Flavihumibacter rivuli]ULQ57697.1 hypothetical protein KJS94_05725 [Flavihumibacter rivuli]